MTKIYLIGAGLVIIIIGGFLFSKFAPTKLEITSNPADAKLIINNQEYKTPVQLKLKANNYNILIKKDGYFDLRQVITIKFLSKNQFNFALTKYYTVEDLQKLDVLPFENEHFKISLSNPTNLLIVPNIPFTSDNAPEYFFKTYWQQYNSYAIEALEWLQSHEIDSGYLNENNINIEWWGEEWWPENSNTPSSNNF